MLGPYIFSRVSNLFNIVCAKHLFKTIFVNELNTTGDILSSNHWTWTHIDTLIQRKQLKKRGNSEADLFQTIFIYIFVIFYL